MKLYLYFDCPNDFYVVTNKEDIDKIMSVVNGESNRQWLAVHYISQRDTDIINMNLVRRIIFDE